MISYIFINFPSSLLYFLIFITGLCVGSFLNVVIDRLPNGRGLGGRSAADCCQTILGASDLVPVFSYVILRGRCSNCGKKISLYYPAVELLTAFATLFTILYFPFPESIFYLVNFYFLIVFFFTDLKYGLVSISVFLVGLILNIIYYLYFYSVDYIKLDHIISTGICAAVLAIFIVVLITVTRGRGMGSGDILMVLLFSLITGYPNSLVMIYLSFIIGGVVSLVLLVAGKKKFGQSLPFGPFLCLATVVSVVYGGKILDMYTFLLAK
jgi:leader peptidase (prepilin peptidase)/N-methyltransferase